LVNKVSESELEIFLKSYLDKLILPKIIGLSGPLGAGKTTIAKEIIKYFGSTEVVTSPTFNIVKQYSVGDLQIYHIDLYRLGSWSEFLDLDLPLDSDNSLFIIEWINLIPNLNQLDMDIIDITIEDELTRNIKIYD
jgi:tRNA threonylcarbamoyladenosine biosynthesis protein TsaE|tara:strand:- start:5407 stop:5814 length:408 start_codon:yes stop_codon:yes gene_type:complete